MFVSMLSKLPPVVCLREEGGGGGGRGEGGATGLLNERGASNRLPVEFPQVQTEQASSSGVFEGGGGQQAC